jgi:7,8-dihydropterin-6-yl-methyl-4-(beta-D-ribofuranosyl)aminobenzene 5'-phosphate synthase
VGLLDTDLHGPKIAKSFNIVLLPKDIMKIKIVAVGSTVQERTAGHWGISFLIDRDVLFDTFGIPAVLDKNLKKLDNNPSRIRHIVISHNHWDHISGLWDIILKNKDISVYLCPNSGEGLKEKIGEFGARVIESSDFVKIKDHIYVTGEIIGKYDSQPMCEQALVVSSKRGLVIITGCAHPGIIPIVEMVKDHFGEKIYTVIGGFHLIDKNKNEIIEVINKFKTLGITKIGPTHCTGELATGLMREAYQGNFMDICERTCIEIPDA